MRSFIYRAMAKILINGDLRQWRLFLDGIEAGIVNIFSLFRVYTTKIILFVIISICLCNIKAIPLKDRRFMLTRVNNFLTFFSGFDATKSLDNFAFALCKSVHSQITVIFDQNGYLSAFLNIINNLKALHRFVISEIVCKNIVASKNFLT